MPQSNKSFPLIAKTYSGLEDILASELRVTGATNIQIINRAVAFDGDQETIYRANYTCRTALRIQRSLESFKVNDPDDLYFKVKMYPWEKLLKTDSTFLIMSIVNNHPKINHSQYAALRTKDAIVDRFREKTGKRPGIEKNNPDFRISIHISGNHCNLMLDSSGESLHKRGYKSSHTKAPMSEILAAGMIMLSGWESSRPLIDPMCGSGTIPIEAAMIGLNIPAAYFRTSFGFMNWNDFDQKLWEKVKSEANSSIRSNKLSILASDLAYGAYRAARDNIRNARLEEQIQLINKDLSAISPPRDSGWLIMNPPYGQRISDNVDSLYNKLGDVMKKTFSGWQAWVIVAGKDFKFIGLHPSKKIRLFNGPIECRFLKFDLYSGSKKQKKQ